MATSFPEQMGEERESMDGDRGKFLGVGKVELQVITQLLQFTGQVKGEFC